MTDRRIRNLMAQSTTEKLVLENTLKDLHKQAERHRQIQEGGEDAEVLVERAIQLKRNVQKAVSPHETHRPHHIVGDAEHGRR